MKFSKKSISTGRWFKMGKGEKAVEFQIRLVPLSKKAEQIYDMVDGVTSLVLRNEDSWVEFDNALTGWKNIMDEDAGKDKPLSFNTENKRLLHDYCFDIRVFVLEKTAQLEIDLEKERKN